MRKIGEIIVEKGFCSEEDIQRALSVQEKYGSKIGTILINMGTITEDQLLDALSDQFSIPFLKDPGELSFVDIGISFNFL